MEDITESAREKIHDVLSRVEHANLSTGSPSRSLLGLPVRRIIPQDVHSLMDYAGGAAGLLTAAFANTTRARAANVTLSTATTGVSAFTDYKLSLAKVIPIEVHEAIDYTWGLGNILAPFALGYYRKDKMVSWVQMALGMGTIALSLFTDYRSYSARRRGQTNGHARSSAKGRTPNKKKKAH
jgi:hypothetical protein